MAVLAGQTDAGLGIAMKTTCITGCDSGDDEQES